MRLSNAKPISQFKAHAPEILERMGEDHQPVALTLNGKVVGILQDPESFEKVQETLALLKLLALGNAEIERGETVDARKSIAKRRRAAAR